MAEKKIIMISGPSGAGEDSVIDQLKEIFPLERVITSTTRAMREGEAQGNPYYFLNQDEFQKKIEEDGFIEYAELDRGKYYGVSHEELERVLASDAIPLWKVDYKGVLRAKELFGDRVIAIFIWAPLDVIAARIKRRDNASDEFIAARLEYAQGWFDNKAIFDYEVENKEGKLDETVEQVKKIIKKYYPENR